eukprot:58026-Chlamydomonas_euryale.AAC.2
MHARTHVLTHARTTHPPGHSAPAAAAQSARRRARSPGAGAPAAAAAPRQGQRCRADCTACRAA